MSNSADVLLEEWKSLRQEADRKQSFIERLILTTITGNFIIYSFAVTLQGFAPFNALIALLPAALTAMAYFWILRTLYSGLRIAKYITERIEPATGLGWENSLWKPRQKTQKKGKIRWREDVFALFYHFFLLNSILVCILLIMLPYWPYTNPTQFGGSQSLSVPITLRMSLGFAGGVVILTVLAALLARWVWIGPRVNDIVNLNQELDEIKQGMRHGPPIPNREIIAGFSPQWAPYYGISLSFDNPEPDSPLSNGTTQNQQLIPFNHTLEDPLPDLYLGFADAFDELGKHMLANIFSLWLLPSTAYRVTVWEGINGFNLAKVGPKYKNQADTLLHGLPETLNANCKILNQVRECSLTMKHPLRIQFYFERLEIRDGHVLIAKLGAEEKYRQQVKKISKELRRFTEEFEDNFGLKTNSGFDPHVVLGYFGNDTHAKLASAQLEAWTERITERVENTHIQFDQISLYGHTDAVTWYK